MKKTIMIVATLASIGAFAQAPGASGGAAGRGNFLAQQAYSEVQRLSGQFEILHSNQEELANRVREVERLKTENESLKSDIASLKSQLAQLKSETQSMRGEIVRDITKQLDDILKRRQPAPAPAPAPAVGPYREYVVQPGDTLSFIAETFYTKVSKIREMNALKSDNLRVGQKLKVPAK